MESLRVVHVVSSFGSGGMEHIVLRLAAAQRARGYDARMVGVRGGPLEALAEARGVPTEVLAREGSASRALKAASCFASTAADVLHVHNTTSLHYAVLGKLVSGARVVLTEHGQVYRSPTALEWYLTDAATAVSRHTSERSAASFALPEVAVIRNGVEDEPARCSRVAVRAALELGDAPVAVHVARMVPLKAQDVVVRALARLRERAVPLTVVFVGDGPSRVEVERLAAELGLGDDRVRFLGHRDDVPDLLAASDVFLLPSRAEGLPVAVLEAMIKKLPVVATAVGGIGEACTEGREALFVPPDDPEALATALARLVRDPGLRAKLGAAGRARATAEFSFEAMTSRYDDLYRGVLAKGPLSRSATMVDRLRWRMTHAAAPTR